MDTKEFVNYYCSHKSPEYPELSAEDIKMLSTVGALHGPPFYKDDINTVYGILRLLERVTGQRGVRPTSILCPASTMTQAHKPKIGSGEVCWYCNNGADLSRGERCPDCGQWGKKKSSKKRVGSTEWAQSVRQHIQSPEFQKKIQLYRRVLQITESTMTREQAQCELVWGPLAASIAYLWSVEPFAEKYLNMPSESERRQSLEHLGQFAEGLAKLTFPDLRPFYVERLLVSKLIAARLASWLEIDNVIEIWVYLLCPELLPPEKWQLRPLDKRQDPFRRQLERFIQALLPWPGDRVGEREIREATEAASWLFRRVSPEKVTWEYIRRVYNALFPPYRADYQELQRMRASLAAEKLLDVSMIEEFARKFLQGGATHSEFD